MTQQPGGHGQSVDSQGHRWTAGWGQGGPAVRNKKGWQCGIQDLVPDQEWTQCSLHWELGVFPGPPGKSLFYSVHSLSSSCHCILMISSESNKIYKWLSHAYLYSMAPDDLQNKDQYPEYDIYIISIIYAIYIISQWSLDCRFPESKNNILVSNSGNTVKRCGGHPVNGGRCWVRMFHCLSWR